MLRLHFLLSNNTLVFPLIKPRTSGCFFQVFPFATSGMAKSKIQLSQLHSPRSLNYQRASKLNKPLLFIHSRPQVGWSLKRSHKGDLLELPRPAPPDLVLHSSCQSCESCITFKELYFCLECPESFSVTCSQIMESIEMISNFSKHFPSISPYGG